MNQKSFIPFSGFVYCLYISIIIARNADFHLYNSCVARLLLILKKDWKKKLKAVAVGSIL